MPRLGKDGAPSRRSSAVEAVRHAWFATFSSSVAPNAGAQRMRWSQLCAMTEFLGRWVALDGVTYDDGHPVDGEVIDADDDLATLCSRVQSDDGMKCTILFCDASGCGARRNGIG